MKVVICILMSVAGFAGPSTVSAQLISDADDEFHVNVKDNRVTYAGTVLLEVLALGPIQPALSLGSFSIGKDSDELYPGGACGWSSLCSVGSRLSDLR